MFSWNLPLTHAYIQLPAIYCGTALVFLSGEYTCGVHVASIIIEYSAAWHHVSFCIHIHHTLDLIIASFHTNHSLQQYHNLLLLYLITCLFLLTSFLHLHLHPLPKLPFVATKNSYHLINPLNAKLFFTKLL